MISRIAVQMYRHMPLAVSQRVTAWYFSARKVLSLGWNRQFHCQPAVFPQANMKIKLIPALEDNYMYLLIDEGSGKAAIIDPVEPDSVLSAVKEENVQLEMVLTTHHHWDHAGGNVKLIQLLTAESPPDAKQNQPAVAVFGGDDRIGALSHKVAHDQVLSLGSLRVRCLYTPCHTSGHVCYHVTSDNNATYTAGVVFTGDTLFQGGCGRFFEGTAEQMYRALIDILSKLPDDTAVYCGHEYTLRNLAFAKHVEPDNHHIAERISWAEQQRKQGLTTIPSTIGMEKQINPFMRVLECSVQTHTKTNTGVETMAALRREKDTF